MLEQSEVSRIFNVAAAHAGAEYAAWLLGNGIKSVHVAGEKSAVRSKDLYEKAQRLHARCARPNDTSLCMLSRFPRLRPKPSDSLSSLLSSEFAETLAWAAGLRETLPPFDMPVHFGLSATFAALWANGVDASASRRVSFAKVRNARRACAAWQWRLRVEWLRVHAEVVARDLRLQSRYPIKRRWEFIELIKPTKLVSIDGGDFLLSEGGPLGHNFFYDVSERTKHICRPRYEALSIVLQDIKPELTLAHAWTEAAGKDPGGDVHKWPTDSFV